MAHLAGGAPGLEVDEEENDGHEDQDAAEADHQHHQRRSPHRPVQAVPATPQACLKTNYTLSLAACLALTAVRSSPDTEIPQGKHLEPICEMSGTSQASRSVPERVLHQ